VRRSGLSQRFTVTQYCVDSAVGKLAQRNASEFLMRGMKKPMHPRWVRMYDIYEGGQGRMHYDGRRRNLQEGWLECG
jgi:hypothetical protein